MVRAGGAWSGRVKSADPANLSGYGYRCLTSFGDHQDQKAGVRVPALSSDYRNNGSPEPQMMRIADQKALTSVNGAQGARSAAAASGARFTLDIGAAAVRLEAQAPISITGGLEALIALQSEDSSRERRRRSTRRGQAMLDVLDELKLALLSGHLPPDMQARLGTVLREGWPSGDPQLDGIIDSIELRAEVELAKLKQAQRRDR
jgi:Class II flagellar assembly regulator